MHATCFFQNAYLQVVFWFSSYLIYHIAGVLDGVLASGTTFGSTGCLANNAACETQVISTLEFTYTCACAHERNFRVSATTTTTIVHVMS